MSGRILTRRLAAGVATLALAAVAFYGGTALRAMLDPGAAAYAENATYSGPAATAEQVTLDGEEQGIVVLGANQPLHVQTSLGGLSGYQRALQVADRLNSCLADGLQGEQVQTQQVDGAWVVAGGATSLITVNQEEADRWGLTAAELAEIWAVNLQITVDAAWETPAGEQPAEEQPAEQPPAEEQPAEQPAEQAEEQSGEWQPPEPYQDKIVPLLSIGEGKRIGIARINGPSSAVAQVQAVAQLETSYKNTLDVEVYIPISTKVPGQTLSRIQGVGVTGVGDLRIR